MNCDDYVLRSKFEEVQGVAAIPRKSQSDLPLSLYLEQHIFEVVLLLYSSLSIHDSRDVIYSILNQENLELDPLDCLD